MRRHCQSMIRSVKRGAQSNPEPQRYPHDHQADCSRCHAGRLRCQRLRGVLRPLPLSRTTIGVSVSRSDHSTSCMPQPLPIRWGQRFNPLPDSLPPKPTRRKTVNRTRPAHAKRAAPSRMRPFVRPAVAEPRSCCANLARVKRTDQLRRGATTFAFETRNGCRDSVAIPLDIGSPPFRC